MTTRMERYTAVVVASIVCVGIEFDPILTSRAYIPSAVLLEWWHVSSCWDWYSDSIGADWSLPTSKMETASLLCTRGRLFSFILAGIARQFHGEVSISSMAVRRNAHPYGVARSTCIWPAHWCR